MARILIALMIFSMSNLAIASTEVNRSTECGIDPGR